MFVFSFFKHHKQYIIVFHDITLLHAFLSWAPSILETSLFLAPGWASKPGKTASFRCIDIEVSFQNPLNYSLPIH